MMDTPLLALTRPRQGGLAGRSPPDAAAENMRQLIQLRWLAVAGQLVAILFAHFGLGVTLPLAAMLAVVAALAVANLLFTLTLRRPLLFPGELLLALLLDMGALTAQLYLSGGASNPFISLYLLQVVLGAILLRPASVWLLVAASSLCFAFLSLAHLPLQVPALLPQATLVLVGEWVSFFMVATLLVLFIGRISRNLRARDSYVAELGQRAAEEDGIVRMGLFASGAAHELGTPLSSLSVLVADWQRHPMIAADPELREELADAEGELQRCKEIVSDILHSAGHSRGEAMGSTAALDLLDEIVAAWRSLHADVPLDYRPDGAEGAKVAAEPALRQAIWSLLENAAEASPRLVALTSETEGDRLVISVLDEGPGFPAEMLAGIGELYRSSKGAGHGLGLFLAGNVARRLGGSLDVANRDRGGAAVRLSLPLVSAPPVAESA
jgi:two-component system sensor histidine kinase RegB